MTISRREVLAGSAAVAAVGANFVGFPRGAAAPRQPLTPIGYIRVGCADRREYPLLKAVRYHLTLPSEENQPSQEQQQRGLLNIYRALIEGNRIEAADLEGLGCDRFYNLVSLGCRYHDRRNYNEYVQRPYNPHDRAVCQWLDREIAQFVGDDWRVTPSEWAAHRRNSLGLFDRANDLYAYGYIDEALEACDEVIEQCGIEDEAGERSLLAKFFWLREAGRIEESNIIWDQIWRCIADVPAHVWGVAWQRVDRPRNPCRSFEHLRTTAGVPQIDLALGQTPNERYRNLTSKIVEIGKVWGSSIRSLT
jgi:hypothetical protein